MPPYISPQVVDLFAGLLTQELKQSGRPYGIEFKGSVMLLLGGLTSVFALLFVVVPVRRFYREENQRNFDAKLKLYKAWAVRNYYPTLQDLSLEEIERDFDVESAYHNIGRRFLKNQSF